MFYMNIQLNKDSDGFVLNVGREEWQRHRSADCFAATKRLPESTAFKLFFSFDMTYVSAISDFFKYLLSPLL